DKLTCQKGWRLFKSSCYLFYDADPPDQKTWEEAREDCRERSSDLADELRYFSQYTHWYWIGLRAEGGRWKWINGSDLTESGWRRKPPPPTDGQCVVYDMFRWRSESCAERRPWICKKKTLSV
uniref:C-type lectin domain-containing protein n=1 Tax=Sander lucioperca TaxID=283035 RepID=A0A8C9ZBT1_SANLU